MLPRTLLLSLAAAMVVASSTSSAQAQFGSIKGQVVVDGEFVKLKDLVTKGDAAAKDSAVCAAEAVPDDAVVVDPATKGLSGVFIYLKKAPAKIAPGLVKPANPEVVFDQKNCRFMPHSLVVRTDQTVKVLSDDAVAHNTHTYPLKNTGVNLVIAANDRKGSSVPNKMSEKLPFSVKCDIHPWMQAWWLVVDHPYATVTKADGTFQIDDLPAGSELEFVVWHEKPGYIEKSLKLKVDEGKTLEVKPIKVPAASLK